MSDLKVRLTTPSQNKVVLNDTGTPLTLSAFQKISSPTLSLLPDVNMNSSPDDSILVFDSSTQGFTLRQFVTYDSTTDTITISGGTF